MESNWPLKSLKELGVTLIDCVHKTPTAVEKGIPYIGIPQMKNGIIDFSANPRLISEEDYQLWTAKAKPTHGDIVLSRRCNPGETAYVPRGSKFALGQNLVLLRPDSKKIHPGYLRWVVNSPIWWDEVSKYKNPGAVFDSLKCADIPNFEVPEPTYSAQILIDKCLLDISNKIELNSQINQTLEQMAQALFKSWFVDFDPVVDNALDAGFFEQDLAFPDELLRRAEARRTVREHCDFKPLPDATRQLFPAAFEECAEPSLGLGGWVPEGWENIAIYSLAEFVNGAAYKAFEPNLDKRGLPIIKIAELKAGVTAQTAFSDQSMPEKYRLTTGDILFSWSGNPDTSIDTFVWTYGDAWLNQHIFKVSPPNIIGERSFVLIALKSLRSIFAETARNKQTTGLGHVTVADLKRLQIMKPGPNVLAAWDHLVSPYVNQILGKVRTSP